MTTASLKEEQRTVAAGGTEYVYLLDSWSNLIYTFFRKKLLLGPLVSRWRPEKIVETKMFSVVAGMNTVTEQM